MRRAAIQRIPLRGIRSFIPFVCTRNSRGILLLLHFYSAIISPIYPAAGESLLIKRAELSRGEVDAIPD